MKLALAVLATFTMAIANATVKPVLPQSQRPVRIQVNHADPWMIVALLDGQRISSPELSAFMNFKGFPASNANPWYGKGKLLVNPTDNSIWFFPEK